MKCGRNVLQVNIQRLTELGFSIWWLWHWPDGSCSLTRWQHFCVKWRHGHKMPVAMTSFHSEVLPPGEWTNTKHPASASSWHLTGPFYRSQLNVNVNWTKHGRKRVKNENQQRTDLMSGFHHSVAVLPRCRCRYVNSNVGNGETCVNRDLGHNATLKGWYDE